MLRLATTFFLIGIVNMTPQRSISAETSSSETPPALSYTMTTLGGEDVELGNYLGKAILVVNVASECGLTPQYEQLQALHKQYSEQGLAILGFPCNQFGGQEPGTAQQIEQFCQANYGVEFDMFSKVEVNGAGACDLYKYLKAQETEPKGPGDIKWNFEKFLLNRQGEVVARFAPNVSPSDESVTSAIEQQLAE